MHSKQVLLSYKIWIAATAMTAAVGVCFGQTTGGQNGLDQAARASISQTAAPHATGPAPSAAADFIFLNAAHEPGVPTFGIAPSSGYLPAPQTSSQQKDESDEVPNDASHQGIKMHGHWIIDIKNPDGTLVEHRDFENSIVNFGENYLFALMAGYTSPSDYAIAVAPAGTLGFENPNSGPCSQGNFIVIQGCAIVHNMGTDPGYSVCNVFYCGGGLTITYNFPSGASPSMVLSGSITATQAGTISQVATYFGACPYSPTQLNSVTTVSPATCAATSGGQTLTYYSQLSGTSLSSAVSVAANQIIQVTVTITFS
jgi:hypothetical protein